MLRTRIITALVILPVVLLALFVFPPWAWLAFTLLVMGAAAWEWTRLAGFNPSQVRFFLVFATALAVTTAVLFLVGRWPWFGDALRIVLGLSAFFWAAVVPLWLLNLWQVRSPWLNALAGIMVLFPTWLAMLMLREGGPWLMLSFAVIVWVADVAAYFSGKKFGKRKLAPSISPGKTIEGVIGGVVAVIAYYFLWRYLALEFPVNNAVTELCGQGSIVAALFVLLALVSVIGDLFESWMKRGVGMKDSSNLLPGHGGVLDRIDALTSTLPLATLYMVLYVYPS